MSAKNFRSCQPFPCPFLYWPNEDSTIEPARYKILYILLTLSLNHFQTQGKMATAKKGGMRKIISTF